MENEAARTGLTDESSASRHNATVDAQLALLRARYGAAFSGDDLGIARASISMATKRAARIRQVPLANADEPVGTFVPYRGDDRGGEA